MRGERPIYQHGPTREGSHPLAMPRLGGTRRVGVDADRQARAGDEAAERVVSVDRDAVLEVEAESRDDDRVGPGGGEGRVLGHERGGQRGQRSDERWSALRGERRWEGRAERARKAGGASDSRTSGGTRRDNNCRQSKMCARAWAAEGGTHSCRRVRRRASTRGWPVPTAAGKGKRRGAQYERGDGREEGGGREAEADTPLEAQRSEREMRRGDRRSRSRRRRRTYEYDPPPRRVPFVATGSMRMAPTYEVMLAGTGESAREGKVRGRRVIAQFLRQKKGGRGKKSQKYTNLGSAKSQSC